jgi:c-di-GMP-binding flagellar brake protein YcgR
MNPKPHVGIAKFEKELEKRLHPRFLLNLPVEYYPIDSPGAAQGHTLNASQGGLMVCLRELFQKGQYISLKIFFSSGANLFAIATKAEVMWVDQKMGEDGTYRYGVKFVEISEGDLAKLKSFLDGISPNLMA